MFFCLISVMKKLLLPISAIAGCSSITFAAGSTFGMKQIDAPALQPSSTPKVEQIVKQQPQNDLEAACQEGNREVCEQIEIAKDLLEFQNRVQRITERAKEEIASLNHERDFPIVKINQEDIQDVREAMEPVGEVSSRIRNMPTVLLTQVVTSSLRPLGSIQFNPIEALDFQPLGFRGYRNRNDADQTAIDVGENPSGDEFIASDEDEIR